MDRTMVLEILELTQILKELREIKERIKRLESVRELPEWLDLRTAAKLKGIPYDTIKDRSKLWPLNGHKIAGVRKFRREEVFDWLTERGASFGYWINAMIYRSGRRMGATTNDFNGHALGY